MQDEGPERMANDISSPGEALLLISLELGLTVPSLA